jgi:multiple sugar transport system substrate-binding protein
MLTKTMRRRTVLGLMGGAPLAMAGWTRKARAADKELTIFWAEWDPANYLQELVNDFTKESGIKVTVETTPWSDFQTKSFTELNAHGDAYDLIVGDSQWLGVGSERGHWVDLTDFFTKHHLSDSLLPATISGYAEYPAKSGKYWAIPLEGDVNGWAYRKDWFTDPTEMKNFKAKYGYDLGVPKDQKALHDIAEFFYRPDQHRYGVALYSDNSYDAVAMGVEQTIFSYGGSLGDYATYKVDGIVNSKESIAGLQAYHDLFRFTPPGWNKAFFVESNQAITNNLAAMAMNFFAFFPALANPQTNPHAAGTGYFANPPGPGGAHFAALGGQGVSIVSYSKKRDMAMQFLEWFVKDATQKKWAALGGYTCSKAVLESPEFLNATPYNQAFYDSMKIVRDFWATPEYADLLLELNNNVYPYVVSDKGTAKEALDGVVRDWTATFKKNHRYK